LELFLIQGVCVFALLRQLVAAGDIFNFFDRAAEA
jgi:hypothetical protein